MHRYKTHFKKDLAVCLHQKSVGNNSKLLLQVVSYPVFTKNCIDWNLLDECVTQNFCLLQVPSENIFMYQTKEWKQWSCLSFHLGGGLSVQSKEDYPKYHGASFFQTETTESFFKKTQSRINPFRCYGYDVKDQFYQNVFSPRSFQGILYSSIMMISGIKSQKRLSYILGSVILAEKSRNVW